MYVDLGYATDLNDFNESESDYESEGDWDEFDQGDFVGIDSTLGREWNWDLT